MLFWHRDTLFQRTAVLAHRTDPGSVWKALESSQAARNWFWQPLGLSAQPTRLLPQPTELLLWPTDMLFQPTGLLLQPTRLLFQPTGFCSQ